MRIVRYAALGLTLTLPVGVVAQRASDNKPAGSPAAQAITVYKTATCGCCTKWVDHLKAAGFNPTVHVVNDMSQSPITKRVPDSLRSCHTATLEGYLVEGHVPADVIKQLLKDRPKVEGIAVPGMPSGSPGMESPNPEPYQVIAFDAAGKTTVFAKK
jgi:hypothetical protein